MSNETEFYVQSGSADDMPMRTHAVEHKIDRLPWQKSGLSYTATGYGKKIPTEYKVKYTNRWYRVYCCIFSNSGTLYITRKGQNLTVTQY